jgi:hypothetical protein
MTPTVRRAKFRGDSMAKIEALTLPSIGLNAS